MKGGQASVTFPASFVSIVSKDVPVVVTATPMGPAPIYLASSDKTGFTVAHLAPRDGIFRGSSAVIALGDGSVNENLVVADRAQVVALQPQRRGYPGSLMGAVAVVRQAFLDARWYLDARAAYAPPCIWTFLSSLGRARFSATCQSLARLVQ